MNKINLRFSIICSLILVVALTRLIPHFPNFSPLNSICLFGAAYFLKDWHKYILPLVAIWLSDVLVNNIIYRSYFDGFTWFYQGAFWQYFTYGIIILCGTLLFKKIDLKRVMVAPIISTILFFVISNFGCWYHNPLYSQDFSGLVACYTAGLPFLKGTILSDCLFTFILFGSQESVLRFFSILKKRCFEAQQHSIIKIS
jgi:hypothetical protein